MSPSDFCFWLNGYLEMSGAESIDKVQMSILKDHLKLVFDKKTPYYTYGGGISLTSLQYNPIKGFDGDAVGSLEPYIPHSC